MNETNATQSPDRLTSAAEPSLRAQHGATDPGGAEALLVGKDPEDLDDEVLAHLPLPTSSYRHVNMELHHQQHDLHGNDAGLLLRRARRLLLVLVILYTLLHSVAIARDLFTE